MKGKPQIYLQAGESVDIDANKKMPAQGQIINIKGIYDQNSHIIPMKLPHIEKCLINHTKSSWTEYVPASYDGSREVPLVVSRPGGGHTGWLQCYATSWSCVADREGLIVIFPDINSEAWHFPTLREQEQYREECRKQGIKADILHLVFDIFSPADHLLIREMKAMIEDVCSRYRIDRTRIFMHGMSMGDLFTMNFALRAGSLLAGIGQSTGPAPADVFFDKEGKPGEHETYVPAYIDFGTNNDLGADRQDRPVNLLETKEMQNLRFWKTVNKTTVYPKLRIHGNENLAVYEGGMAPVIYREVFGRGHGQTFDSADTIWSRFFSGLSRMADGSIVYSNPAETDYDTDSIALADGTKYAYVGSERRLLDEAGSRSYYVNVSFEQQDGTEKPPGFEDVLYVPLSFLNVLGYQTVLRGDYAELLSPRGERIQVAAGNIGIVLNNRIYSIDRQVEKRDGILYIPIKWFAWHIGLHVSERNHVMYINKVPCALSPNMAAIITEILKD